MSRDVKSVVKPKSLLTIIYRACSDDTIMMSVLGFRTWEPWLVQDKGVTLCISQGVRTLWECGVYTAFRSLVHDVHTLFITDVLYCSSRQKHIFLCSFRSTNITMYTFSKYNIKGPRCSEYLGQGKQSHTYAPYFSVITISAKFFVRVVFTFILVRVS